MKLLALLTQPYLNKTAYKTFEDLITRALENNELEELCCFFTSKAALISVLKTKVAQAYGADFDDKQFEHVQNFLISLKPKANLLVCGRAFNSLEFEKDSLNPNFELSGNAEMSMMISEYDKVIEF